MKSPTRYISDIISTLPPSVLILRSFFYIFLFFVAAVTIKSSQTDMYVADSKVYYSASKTLVSGNIGKIYDHEYQKLLNIEIFKDSQNYMLFLNTPVSLLPFVAFSHLSYRAFYIIWVVINTLLIGLSVCLISRRMKISTGVTFYLPLFIPVISALYLNQLTPFILFLYSLIVINLKKPVLSGVITGLLLFKPQHLLFAPFVFLTFQTRPEMKKYLQGFVLTLVLLSLINVFLYGPRVYTDYIGFIQGRDEIIKQWEEKDGYNLYVFKSWFSAHTGNVSYAVILPVIQVFLYTASLFFIRRTQIDLASRVSGGIFLSTVLNFHTKYSDLLLLIIPFLLLAGSARWKKENSLINNIFANRQAIIISLLILLVPALYFAQSRVLSVLILMGCGFWLLLSDEALKGKYLFSV